MDFFAPKSAWSVHRQCPPGLGSILVHPCFCRRGKQTHATAGATPDLILSYGRPRANTGATNAKAACAASLSGGRAGAHVLQLRRSW
jgi:hypothetical protein